MEFTVYVKDFIIKGKTAIIESEFVTFNNVLLTENSNLESGRAVLKIVVNKKGQLTTLCIK